MIWICGADPFWTSGADLRGCYFYQVQIQKSVQISPTNPQSQRWICGTDRNIDVGLRGASAGQFGSCGADLDLRGGSDLAVGSAGLIWLWSLDLRN